ncbi:MAG: hypothetical protein MJ219_02580 [Mycoplasmoidaceae bacterium]|nr:hypothetical protein [Mycoplasmoidaceae bacterium]
MLVPLAVIICRIIIFATDNGHSSSTVLTNAEEAIKYLTLINAITGVL